MIPYREGREEGVGLHGRVQAESGMLLMMSGLTIGPGNNLGGGRWSLAIKRNASCFLIPVGNYCPTWEHNSREEDVIINIGG